jgi:hypothetical protein
MNSQKSISKIKGNPVPSIDIIKLKEQYYKEKPRLHVSHTTAIDSFSTWLRQEIIIQNGVETNKEQPKCVVCDTFTNRKHSYKNEYVCIDCSHYLG